MLELLIALEAQKNEWYSTLSDWQRITYYLCMALCVAGFLLIYFRYFLPAFHRFALNIAFKTSRLQPCPATPIFGKVNDSLAVPCYFRKGNMEVFIKSIGNQKSALLENLWESPESNSDLIELSFLGYAKPKRRLIKQLKQLEPFLAKYARKLSTGPAYTEKIISVFGVCSYLFFAIVFCVELRAYDKRAAESLVKQADAVFKIAYFLQVKSPDVQKNCTDESTLPDNAEYILNIAEQRARESLIGYHSA